METVLISPNKSRVTLDDFDLESDISCRKLLASLNIEESEILEEILYSSLSFSVDTLCNSTGKDQKLVENFLNKLKETNLLTFDGYTACINKERRKYFEIQVERIEEDFLPDLEFFHSLLKNVPIEVLPIWYHIPRSSNNIFESLIEKYLLSPQVYSRYLMEFCSGDDTVSYILRDLLSQENLQLDKEIVKQKYSLSDEDFIRIAIYMEYNFLAFMHFITDNGKLKQVLSPLAEWKTYLMETKKLSPSEVTNQNQVIPFRENSYAFIEDMTKLLVYAKNSDLKICYNRKSDLWEIDPDSMDQVSDFINIENSNYLNRLLNKILILGLSSIEDVYLNPSDASQEWMEMPIEKRCHVTFKHPHNFLSIQKRVPGITQRMALEIEKSLECAKEKKWISFNEFIDKAIIILSEEKKVVLKKEGRSWKYTIPKYSEDDIDLIKTTILDWLFESGIVETGRIENEDCFCLTPLGQSLI